MLTLSFLSVLVMFFIDGYFHVFSSTQLGGVPTSLEVAVTVLGRLFQYHAVPLSIYYVIYWPYRLNFMPKQEDSFDVPELSPKVLEQEMNSQISRGGSIAAPPFQTIRQQDTVRMASKLEIEG